MTTKNTLASAALTGLLTVGLLAAQPALAGEHDKSACAGKSGCKGKSAAEKSACKGQDKDASACNGKAESDKASCSGKSGCAGKDEAK